MNRCSNCDKEISSDVKFCPHCGTANASAQAEDSGARRKVTAVRMVACSACNQEVPDHQKYCPKCGHENLNSRYAQPTSARASESASPRAGEADAAEDTARNDRRPPQYTRQGPMHTIRTSNVEIKLSKEGIYVDTRKPGDKEGAASEPRYAPQPPVPPSTVSSHSRHERRDPRPPHHVRDNAGRKKAGAVVLLMAAVIVGMILLGINTYLFGIVGALVSIGVGTWIVATRRYEKYSLGKLFGVYAVCLLVFLLSVGVLARSGSPVFTTRSIQMNGPVILVPSATATAVEEAPLTEAPLEVTLSDVETSVDAIVQDTIDTTLESFGVTRTMGEASKGAAPVEEAPDTAAQSGSLPGTASN